MREHRLTSILRRIYESAPTDTGGGETLEADLLARYRKLHPKNRRWLALLNPWNRAARFGFAGLAVCLLVIGACATDTITEVDVGKQVLMSVDPNADPRFIHMFIHIDEESPGQPQNEFSELLTAQPGVEDVSVSTSVRAEGERNVSVEILIFGSDLDGEGIVDALTDSFPFLSRAAVTINDLRTTFSESLASRMVRTLFRIKGSLPDPQELRLQVLQEMSARG